MKKTVIAMAVAAVMPVAAQADATLSGELFVETRLGSGEYTTKGKVSLDSEEVLSNGMTATASLDVLGSSAQGNLGLEFNHGKLSAARVPQKWRMWLIVIKEVIQLKQMMKMPA